MAKVRRKQIETGTEGSQTLAGRSYRTGGALKRQLKGHSKGSQKGPFLVGTFTIPAAVRASRFAFLVAFSAFMALAFARATVVFSKLAFFAIPEILLQDDPVGKYIFPRTECPKPWRRLTPCLYYSARSGNRVTHWF